MSITTCHTSFLQEGYTPYDLAFHGEYDECAAFLKAEEARRKSPNFERQAAGRAFVEPPPVNTGFLKVGRALI